jgi:hypothetical protein
MSEDLARRYYTEWVQARAADRRRYQDLSFEQGIQRIAFLRRMTYQQALDWMAGRAEKWQELNDQIELVKEHWWRGLPSQDGPDEGGR